MKVDNTSAVDEDDVTMQIEALEKEKRKLEKKLSKIFDDYEEGLYSANEFVQRKAKHNERIEAIVSQIRELENTIPEKTEYEEKILSLTQALDMLQDDTIDAATKNEYLKEIIDKVEFSRENNDEFLLDIYIK